MIWRIGMVRNFSSFVSKILVKVNLKSLTNWAHLGSGAALFERDPNFTPLKIYGKRINVNEINPFPNLPERIGDLEEWLITCGGSAIQQRECSLCRRVEACHMKIHPNNIHG
jgi:hypothetical protein